MFAYLPEAIRLDSSCLSVCLRGTTRLPPDGFFHDVFDVGVISENLSREFKFCFKSDRNNGYFT